MKTKKLRRIKTKCLPIKDSHTCGLFPCIDTWVSQVSGIGNFIRLPDFSGSQTPGKPEDRNSVWFLGYLKLNEWKQKKK